jgi:hypothetical protein
VYELFRLMAKYAEKRLTAVAKLSYPHDLWIPVMRPDSLGFTTRCSIEMCRRAGDLWLQGPRDSRCDFGEVMMNGTRCARLGTSVTPNERCDYITPDIG